jgi:ATP-dependent RNA helicase DDX3X
MSEHNFEDVTADVTADLGEIALSEAGTEKPKPEQNFVGAPADLAEAEAKARDYLWAKKVDYDYTAYAPTKDGTATIEPANHVPWASSAVKYEWLEEYGEVAPRIPELEAQLFDLEFLHRTGENMSNLDLHVKMEGAVRIEPITKVGSFRLRITITLY